MTGTSLPRRFTHRVVGEQARALRAPPMTLIQLLDVLTVSGLDESVARMRELLG